MLIVPYKTTADLNGLTEEELSDLTKLTRRCQNALTQVMKPDGFNIGLNLGTVAGAGITDHVHFHIVPRWIRRHQFHAGARQRHRAARSAGRGGGETARRIGAGSMRKD